MSTRHRIVIADPGDTDALSALIAESFHSLDPSVWLVPDDHERRQIMPGYFRLFVTDAMARGHVYTTPDRTAVALWFPVDEHGHPGSADYDAGLPAATGRRLDRFKAFDEQLAAHHPGRMRHDHLAILAVHPAHQRRGIGSELLDTHHRHLDQVDPPVAAYLEASDAHTRKIYLARGYADHGGPIRLPDGPLMYPMLRRPESRASREPADK